MPVCAGHNICFNNSEQFPVWWGQTVLLCPKMLLSSLFSLPRCLLPCVLSCSQGALTLMLKCWRSC